MLYKDEELCTTCIAGYGALLIFDLNLMKFSFERPLAQMKLPKQNRPKTGKIVQ